MSGNGQMSPVLAELTAGSLTWFPAPRNDQEDKSVGVGASALSSARRHRGRISDTRGLQTPAKRTPVHRRLPSLPADPQRLRTPTADGDELLKGAKP